MKNPYVSLLRTAWQYARQQKRRYVLVYALFLCANVIGALHPLLFGWFINQIQAHNASVLTVCGWYLGGFMTLKLAEWAFHGPARILEREVAFHVSQNFLEELYHQTLHLPVRWHKEHHSGATINRIRKAYDALKLFFQSGFTYLHTLLKCVFSFSAMLYFSPAFGLVGVALGVLTVWVIMTFDKPFIRTLEETNEREHIVASTLFDSLSNIITVITLRLEKQMQGSLMGKVLDTFGPFRQNIRINEWKWFVASMLVATIYAVITMGYVWQNYTPGTVFYVGGLVALIGYVNNFTSVFVDVAWQYTQIVQYNTDVETAKGISEAFGRNERPEPVAELPDNWQTIDISGLNFSHSFVPGLVRRRAGLQDVAIHIERGRRVALIGESGSGKSTLLTLLRGLYAPDPTVRVLVDGEQQAGLDLIANTVTLFPQEPEIFENTVAYNITLGLPFSEADVLAACESARFAEIVGMLPQGLQTFIQEKGVNLSGGQKQRLALARGVLAARSSDIVLLDEPTSSVDPKTEFDIYHKLLEEFSDKAVVSTLHRLHLLPMFDYIYVMRNGHVVDEGTFMYLRQHSPIFSEMWRHQQERTELAEAA
ncbi:ATP-binding cassette domain-containing protein [Rudanella paleaurantiibacter]|uniref:ATP-binding cassette domain-containing protein n=1 Tax=Rudanella paleaurantiibacter TaxID=2614655 RepID=A0A7J5U1X8_9BACT|nr:ABC transporter ATP-binding protein [Rudanella paleaurantiibacter]KAB7731681.1 ATP-binding cassette domain-containing protein [Rudanella paleaurantiibacter]